MGKKRWARNGSESNDASYAQVVSLYDDTSISVSNNETDKVLTGSLYTETNEQGSHVFQISRNTIYGWLKLKEKTGELNHQVKGTKPRKVDRDRLKNYLTDNPDAYLTEIASEFACHPTTIHYALKAMGYTRKKEPHLL
ncbi:Spn1 transposase [Streptococcus pneumoniae]|nr:Spn1 transposase [Streptococcus pneumoniae]